MHSFFETRCIQKWQYLEYKIGPPTIFCKSLASNVEHLLNNVPQQKLNFLRKKQSVLQKKIFKTLI